MDPSEYEPQVVELPPSPPPSHDTKKQGNEGKDEGDRWEEEEEVVKERNGNGGKEQGEAGKNGRVRSVL